MARRHTGFDDETKTLVHARSGGMCEGSVIPGCTWQGSEFHHRMTRGMGSAKVDCINDVSNCLLLCAACHRWITEHPDRSYRSGWAVRRNGKRFPDEVQVWLRRTRWVRLDDHGHYLPAEHP